MLVRVKAVAVGSIALVAMLGCASTQTAQREDLSGSAEKLASNAATFAESTEHVQNWGSYHYSADARALAGQALSFREAVQDKGVDDPEVKAAFDELSHTYGAVSSDVNNSGNTWLKGSWSSVKDAYQNVAGQMSAAPGDQLAEGSGEGAQKR